MDYKRAMTFYKSYLSEMGYFSQALASVIHEENVTHALEKYQILGRYRFIYSNSGNSHEI